MVPSWQKIFRIPGFKKKVFITLLIILSFRVLSYIPLPGADLAALKSLFSGNSFLGIMNMFSGGGMQNFSIITLGLNPYINASIIVNLLTTLIPKLEELAQEGEYGRERINQYTKYLSIPLALLQAYGTYFLLNRQGILINLSFFQQIVMVLTLTGGSVFLVWLGDIISLYGFGNGISLLIFTGIVSRIPESLGQITSLFSLGQISIFTILGVLVSFSLLLFGVVLVDEAVLKIPIRYASQIRQGGYSRDSFLPVKVNQSGVIPIIFALSLIMIPGFVGEYLKSFSNTFLFGFGQFLSSVFNSGSYFYTIFYFLLVVGFTYFYTAIYFDTKKISENIQKNGGFIPGIRPGKSSASYLNGVISRITLIGAVFLGLIAVLPNVSHFIFGSNLNLSLGGTSLLIVVSVVLEMLRQMESQLTSHDYDSFI